MSICFDIDTQFFFLNCIMELLANIDIVLLLTCFSYAFQFNKRTQIYLCHPVGYKNQTKLKYFNYNRLVKINITRMTLF